MSFRRLNPELPVVVDFSSDTDSNTDTVFRVVKRYVKQVKRAARERSVSSRWIALDACKAAPTTGMRRLASTPGHVQ